MRRDILSSKDVHLPLSPRVAARHGELNHLHVQLIPRYSGSDIGSARLVDRRGPVLDGEAIAATIRSALTRA